MTFDHAVVKMPLDYFNYKLVLKEGFSKTLNTTFFKVQTYCTTCPQSFKSITSIILLIFKSRNYHTAKSWLTNKLSFHWTSIKRIFKIQNGRRKFLLFSLRIFGYFNIHTITCQTFPPWHKSSTQQSEIKYNKAVKKVEWEVLNEVHRSSPD